MTYKYIILKYREGGAHRVVNTTYSPRHNQDLAEELWKRAELCDPDAVKYVEVKVYD